MSQSTLKAELLRQCMNRTFIETGTAAGEGVQVALDAGFEQIVSIEANPTVFVKACERFRNEPRVLNVLGDSGVVLPQILKGIENPATFWLDAHWSTGEEELGSGVSKCPILYDLRAIGQHTVKTHTILIDDIRYFRAGGLPQWGMVNLGDIMEVILEINADYRIEFANGFAPYDVLVAKIKEPAP